MTPTGCGHGLPLSHGAFPGVPLTPVENNPVAHSSRRQLCASTRAALICCAGNHPPLRVHWGPQRRFPAEAIAAPHEPGVERRVFTERARQAVCARLLRAAGAEPTAARVGAGNHDFAVRPEQVAAAEAQPVAAFSVTAFGPVPPVDSARRWSRGPTAISIANELLKGQWLTR